MLAPATRETDIAAPAFPAHQLLGPVRHRRLGAVAFGHFGRVGLDLVAAVAAPHHERQVRRGGATHRHRPDAVGAHEPVAYRPVTQPFWRHIFYVVEMAWDGQHTMDVIINRQYKAGREARSFD